MTRKVYHLMVIRFGFCVLATLTLGQSAGAQGTVRREMELHGQQRTYLLHVPGNLPTDRPVPLVFVFHGGGGDGAGIERMTRFSDLADREGFIVVYPDGLWKNWNDGRAPNVSRAHRENVDDIGFVSALIDAVSMDYRIDPKRIFATGISNGGIFSHYLGANLSSRIAAIAPVSGGIAEPFSDRFKPENPVSVFIIQGTDDPLVPFHGGGIVRGRRGRIIDTDEAVRLWTQRDGCKPEPRAGTLPDADRRDRCTVKWYSWSRGRENTEVKLFVIQGGGHTWPGGAQYLPALIVGRVCRDFNATEAIWEFFKNHPRP
jgi:polyhydroxybutyrate depolymerase